MESMKRYLTGEVGFVNQEDVFPVLRIVLRGLWPLQSPGVEGIQVPARSSGHQIQGSFRLLLVPCRRRG